MFNGCGVSVLQDERFWSWLHDNVQCTVYLTGCTYLGPLSCAVRMVKRVNVMLRVFHHNQKLKSEEREDSRIKKLSQSTELRPELTSPWGPNLGFSSDSQVRGFSV